MKILKEIDEFNGLDVDWFAIDIEDKVARFTSNGNGIVLIAHHDFEVLIQICNYFDQMDTISQVQKGKEAHANFTEMSKKGLYTFDLINRRDSYKYELISSPSQPIFKERIKKEILKFLPVLPFCFDYDTTINFEEDD